MATLLWLAVGVLAALVSYALPEAALGAPLVVLSLAILGVLLPRDLTAAGARVGIGFGAAYLVLFGPNVLRDPLSATGAGYLLAGGGLVILLLGVAGVVRNRLRRRRLEEAALARL
jgi:hypothetical protein